MKITKSQLRQLISEELDGVTEKVVKRDGKFYVDPKKKGAKTMGPYSKERAERINQARNIGSNMGETLNEDGHVDVASARRKLKTAMEDAAQILHGLDHMSDEGDLPSWWMGKLTLASDYLNKIRDYILVSGD
jgi:hypothetical protein